MWSISPKTFSSLRKSSYRSIDNAIAEPIENAIHASATDIFVILTEHFDPVTRRKAVHEIAILDNGHGMDIATLARCLEFGFTTKPDVGYGVGLPMSSLYVTQNVEVYSWTREDGPIESDDPVRKIILDIDSYKLGKLNKIGDPELSTLPQQYRQFIKTCAHGKAFDFTQHGTLVYWRNCDNVEPRATSAVIDKLEFVLGRKFRHLITSGIQNIRLVTIGHEKNAIDVLPNDPLFLMKPNYVLGNPNDPANISEGVNINCTEPLFETYGDNDGEVIIPVPYIDRVTGKRMTSDICVRFSKIRPEFYDQTAISTGTPDIKPIGKYVKKLEGISIVRAGIEIDFGTFDFYDKTNNPYHRWWGCEIFFDPVLDEVFGVPVNKQYVELRDDFETEIRYNRKSSIPIWDRLAQIIQPTIKKMVEDNKILRKGSRCLK